jgi:DNA-binding NarL/FixJ family response regulator
MQQWRVLLVDDHGLFRDGIRSLLAYESDFLVVGEAADAIEALRAARELQPDLILMDINLPGEDGVAATRRIKAELPGTTIVMLTVLDDSDKLLDAIKAGAQGYLLKDIRSTELLSQLRGLAEGDAPISRRMATRMLEEFRRNAGGAVKETDLTNREIEVLDLVANRLSNKEIAARLVISEHTVKNHLKSILAKLQLRNRREAAAFGISHGWVKPGKPGI